MNSPKTIVILVLALTTVGGAALAYRQYQELVELRAAAMNKDERADLQKRLWELEKTNRELNDQIAASRSDGNDVETALAAATGEPAPERGERGGRGSRGGRGGENSAAQVALRELMAKPEVVAVLDQQRKLAVERQYAALFKNLNLSSEQADKLKTILADRQTTMQDVRNVAREQGIDPRADPEGFRKLMESTRNDINASIKGVIGDAGLAQLQNYEQTMPQRSLVNDLQQRLSYSSAPLSQAQSEQLVQILAANQPARQTQPGATNAADAGGGRGFGDGGGFGGGPGLGGAMGGGRGPGGDLGALAGAFLGSGGGGGRGATITPAAVNQAQSILSQPQVTALQQLQQQQQAQQQLQQAVRTTLQNAAPAAQTGGATGAPAAGGRRRGGG